MGCSRAADPTGVDDPPGDRFRAVGLSKRYGGTQALRGVDFDLRPGEVHALLGENGAGKSTLIGIMSGAVTDYAGEMFLDGEPIRFASPSAAQHSGVATVYQELDLVRGLTVADNLALGTEPRRALWVIDAARMRRDAQRALDRVGSTASPTDRVSSLRLGEQQTVVIAKALAQDARVLILDEPTAALTSREVDRLFALVREVTEDGVAVVFVSHRLDEITAIADRVTVLRDGAVVDTVPADTSQSELVRLLTGHRPDELFPARTAAPGPPRLTVHNLTFVPRHPRAGWRPPTDVSFAVGRGEIVGLVGLLGAGRTELLECLAGAGPPGRLTGVVEVDGRPVDVSTVAGSTAGGLGYVPDDRRSSGFVPQLNVADNLVLSSLGRLTTRAGFLRSRAVTATVADALRRFGVRTASPRSNIMSLSGGNQQKVVIGRTLLVEPQVLLLDEPTRGVDVGAKAEIYRLIRSLTADGLSVLIASSELPELIGLCDRLIVLRTGRVVAEPPLDTAPESLLTLAQRTVPEEIPA